MDAKTAHKYRGSRDIYWCDCPVCEKLTAHFNIRETCSPKCQRKLDKARKWIDENNFATGAHQTVKVNSKTHQILVTNCDPRLIARGRTKGFHYLLAVPGEGSVSIRNLELPLVNKKNNPVPSSKYVVR